MNNSTSVFDYFLCPSLLDPDIFRLIFSYGPLLRWYIVLPLAFINLIGNITSIIIYCKKKFDKISIRIYLVFLSIFAILQTYSIMTQYFLTSTEYFSSDSFMCKFHYYLQTNLPLYVPWYSVLVCIDRLFAVINHRLRKLGETLSFQIWTIVIVTLCITLLNAGYFTNIFFKTFPFFGIILTNICILGDFSLVRLSYYYDIFLMVVVPFVIMVVCNITGGYKLWTLKKKFKRMDEAKRMAKNAKISVAINIVFFLLYTPACVFQILFADAVDRKLYNDRDNCFSYYIFSFLNNIAYILRFSYSSCLCFIYFGTNSIYREYVKSFVADFSRKKKEQQNYN
jgi:hypothetical protein